MIRYKKSEGENPLLSLPNVEDFVWLYDAEIFRNGNTWTFIHAYSGETKQFEITERKNQSKELKKFVKEQVAGLIGYNSIFYDDLMLLFGLSCSFNPSKMFEFSQFLIQDKEPELFSLVRDKYNNVRINASKTWNSLDLMKLAYLDQLGVSLKEVAIRLKFPLIQDLPFHWDEPVPLDKLDMVCKYNKNDVDVTKKLFEYLKDEIQIRIDVEEEYGFNCISSSRPTLAKEFLRHIYLKPKGFTKYDEKHLKTYRNSIKMIDVIDNSIVFQTAKFKGLLEELKAIELLAENPEMGNYKYHFPDKKIEYANKIIWLKMGGIHTDDDAKILVSDDEYALMDLDVASFYPKIVSNLRFYPKHLGQDFNTTYDVMIEDRLKSKKSKPKKAEALKIVINSAYGMFNSEYSFLYDPLCMFKTTINGQLYLLMLSEKIIEAGKENVELVSKNTDGATYKIKRTWIEEFRTLYHEWEKETNFVLEEAEYKKIFRRDVNNYIAIYENGKAKLKGDFTTEIQIGKGYDAPIVSKALYAYYVEGKDYNKFVYEHQDIYDFAMAQKIAKSKFNVWEEKLEEKDKWTFSSPLTKTNRYYACEPFVGFDNILVKARIVEDIRYEQIEKISKKKDGTETRKLVWEWNNHPSRLVSNSRTALLNNVKEDTKIEDYKINYQYYIDRIEKIIFTIDGTWDERQKALKEKIKAEKEALKPKKEKKLTKAELKAQNNLSLWG